MADGWCVRSEGWGSQGWGKVICQLCIDSQRRYAKILDSMKNPWNKNASCIYVTTAYPIVCNILYMNCCSIIRFYEQKGYFLRNKSSNLPAFTRKIQEKPSDLSWVEGRHFASYEVNRTDVEWERDILGQVKRQWVKCYKLSTAICPLRIQTHEIGFLDF